MKKNCLVTLWPHY